MKAGRVLFARPSEDGGDASPFPDKNLFCPLVVVSSQLYYRKLWPSTLSSSVGALCTFEEVAAVRSVSPFLLGTAVLPGEDINRDS